MNFFNGTDAELNEGSLRFSTKINATPGAYGIPIPTASSYAAADLAFREAYLAAADPETRTRGKVAARSAAAATLRAMASDLAKIIDGTATVTDEQKIDLGLNVRATPQKHSVPADRPVVEIVKVESRVVTARIHDGKSASKRSRPFGVAAAQVYSFVGSTYPEDPGDWTYEGPASRNKVQIAFGEDVAPGAQVWICAAWMTTRMETGPLSLPVTANVYGGITHAA